MTPRVQARPAPASAGPARSGRYVDASRPRGYALDYSSLVDAIGPADARGLPQVTTPEGLSYSPALLAKFGLGSLEFYLRTGNPARRHAVETVARWLVANHEEIPGGFLGWPMPTVPRPYARELPREWFSGEAHAECVSLLARASQLLGLDGTADCARRALGGLWTPVEDHGLARELETGGGQGGLEVPLFVEQFPLPDRPSLVLGAHLRAILALHDVGSIGAGGLHESAGAVLRGMLKGLERLLDEFDTGFWSRLDLDERWRTPPVASTLRHGEHVLLLERVAELSGSDAAARTAARWRAYAGSRRARRRAWRWRAAFAIRHAMRHPSEP